jgi:ribosomal protein S18 acetylase RimI-like enzyme
MIDVNKEEDGEFLVRQYRAGDFIQISGLWMETDMGSSLRADDAEIIENTIKMGGALLILEEKMTGSICGTSWLTFDGRRIHLHHFGVKPSYQGKGLANILMKESLKFVKVKGYQVKLEVHQSNLKAIGLYKKAGFEYLGDYDVYIIRDVSKI